MNSRTSRPRSPSSAMTLTSACAWRAIMPSSVLLPTPEPAKMPTRWPRPMVSRPSMARTPVSSGRSIASRSSGLGGSAASGTRSIDIHLALAVDRMAEAVEHAPEQPRADVHAEGATERLHRAARVQAVQLAERHQQHAALVKAHDFGQHRAVPGVARDAAERPEPHLEAGGLEHEADDARDPAVRGEAVAGIEASQHRLDGRRERRAEGGIGMHGERHACTWPMVR